MTSTGNKRPSISGPPDRRDSSRGHSLLFLIVAAIFVLLVSSSIVYSTQTKGTLASQTKELAVSGLATVLQMTYPAVEVLVAREADDAAILRSLSLGLEDKRGPAVLLPFLMESSSMQVLPESLLPQVLSESITRKLRDGDFVGLPVASLPEPARLCQISLSGRVWLVAVVPLQGSDRMLGFAEDISHHLARAQAVQKVLLGFLVLSYAFFLVMLILVLKVITTPLRTLTRAAERFARGDFDAHVTVPGIVSEVRVLAETFNHMGRELKARNESLEAYSHELEDANRSRGIAMVELSRRTSELEQINQFARLMSSELDMDRLLEAVVGFSRLALPADHVVIGLLSGDQLTDAHFYPSTGWVTPEELSPAHSPLVERLIREEQGYLIGDMEEDCPPPVAEFARRNGLKSFSGAPILWKGKVTGVICCFSSEPHAFDSNHIYFLGLLTSQLAVAMDNARLFEEIMARDRRRDHQLAVAQKLQKDRVPESFKKNVAAFTCRLKAAEELAGDFCDVFTLGRNSMALVIGDVANKGVAASLMTFSLISTFRNVAKIHKPPCEVLRAINRALMSQVKEDGWFATAFYAKLNTSTGVLTYSSAGHEAPLWYHADSGEVEMLDLPGYPLGLFTDFHFETREIQMKVGDKLILYTDGVTNTMNSEGQRFGHEKLIKLVSCLAELRGADFTEAVVKRVEEFKGRADQRDDIIVAVLEMQDDPWVRKSILFEESSAFIAEIMEALAPYNLSAKDVYSIRLAVDEAITNAWRHGLKQTKGVPFEVSYLISDEGFQFRVRDSGSGFDHESLPDPTVEENLFKSHGRGVFLIRQVMDEVDFNETGNEMTITKVFPPSVDTDDSSDAETSMGSVPLLMRHQESLNMAMKADNSAEEAEKNSKLPTPVT